MFLLLERNNMKGQLPEISRGHLSPVCVSLLDVERQAVLFSVRQLLTYLLDFTGDRYT